MKIAKSFTPREREVIEQLKAGKTQKQIAVILGISPKTVTTYLGNARFRMEVETNEQMMYELGCRVVS